MDSDQNVNIKEKSSVNSKIVKVGIRRQVVISKAICELVGIDIGDFVEVRTENGEIILRPKKLVDARATSPQPSETEGV